MAASLWLRWQTRPRDLPWTLEQVVTRIIQASPIDAEEPGDDWDGVMKAWGLRKSLRGSILTGEFSDVRATRTAKSWALHSISRFWRSLEVFSAGKPTALAQEQAWGPFQTERDGDHLRIFQERTGYRRPDDEEDLPNMESLQKVRTRVMKRAQMKKKAPSKRWPAFHWLRRREKKNRDEVCTIQMLSRLPDHGIALSRHVISIIY